MQYNVYELQGDPNWLAPPAPRPVKGRKPPPEPLPPVVGRTLLEVVDAPDHAVAMRVAVVTHRGKRISVRRD